MAKITIDEALQPKKVRALPGMIPESAVKLLSAYVTVSITAGRAFGMLPSAAITSAFYQTMAKEWKLEGAFWPHLPMGKFSWENTFPQAVYGTLFRVLSPMSTEQRIQWSWDIHKHFIGMANTPLSAGDKVHTFSDSAAIWFFYRVLVNFLYAVMKSFADAGTDIRQAYTFIQHPGLTVGQSAVLNRAIVDLAAKDWETMGFKGLFSPIQLEEIEKTNRQFNERVAQQWAEYKAKQEALQREIAMLEEFKRLLEAAKTPFDAIKKALDAGTGILGFIGSLPEAVWIGALALGGYLLIVKPILGK